jgi:hypothetical protein
LLLWAVTVIIDSRQPPPLRPDLAERLWPYRRRNPVKEIEEWLRAR